MAAFDISALVTDIFSHFYFAYEYNYIMSSITHVALCLCGLVLQDYPVDVFYVFESNRLIHRFLSNMALVK